MKNSKKADQKIDIKSVFTALKNREQHPRGTFDKAGRFYLEDGDIAYVRSPSRVYPFSEMLHGRTKKFLKALIKKHNCKTTEDLEKVAFA